jgi:hypothetical protein
MEEAVLYFAHPINIYDTEKESELIAAIEAHFGERWVVENPNQPHHSEAYKEWRGRLGSGGGMRYFFEEVLPGCDACIFLAFEDGMIGKGVYGEAKQIHEQGGPIFEIDWDGNIWGAELDERRCLSVEETRKRVYPDKKKQ